MKEYKLNEITYKRILGRNVKNAGETAEPLTLFWGAAALEVNVKASEVWVKVSATYTTHEPWIAVEVNGAPVNRFMAPVEPAWVCIARNMNPEKENLITIMKDTQPMPGEENHALFIHAVGLSDNGTFIPLKDRKLNIEFIGDSITSGEGLAGNSEEMEWITQWMCASKTYARQVAKNLNASWSTFSQCGWGICWGWDGDLNSKMPPHYANVCSILWSDYHKKLGAQETFAFPVKNDYIIVNLGTNDNGAFAQKPWTDQDGIEHPRTLTAEGKACPEDGKIIQEGVVAFLKDIRSHNPAASIIWCWGMIKLQFVPDYIEAGIEEYKKQTGDNKVYSLLLDSMEDCEVTEEDKGSRGHPGPKTHRLAAEKITALISSLEGM